MLADPGVPAEVRAKLRLILDVKDFGERRLGLSPTDNYTTYFDTEGQPVSYGVSACRKDAFVPLVWWFPIVGGVPYKGFFRRDDAREEARSLSEQGYDVQAGAVRAYSTLGWFTDPVLSTMIEEPEERLAELILHEMTHATMWVPGGVNFNEGLAGFVGLQGALEYVREKHGIRSGIYERAVSAFAEEEGRDARARKLFNTLDSLYRADITPERKVELRDEIAGQPVNNAEILNQRRYGRYDEFRKVFDLVRGDWRRFLGYYRGR